ncbi:membrane protein [Pseudomonas sp. RtIB026]|uniref:GtrA family protein n=1 Tax=Pseudomonas sp. RtIB026 TaxID=2749999 RepID=UPI00194581F6|nr:GtrA family protein [Pseudomonas sp. RtIB026]BCJ04969.1 membrane protein [Pseudomonas sp. RtIB026]
MLRGLPRHPLPRFLLSGGFNTVATYALYLLLLSILSYRLSYSIAFVTGIVVAYVLNRTFVFRSHRGIRSVAWMPILYLLQYLMGMLIVWFWVEQLGWPQEPAPLAATLITVPINFVLSKFAFMKRIGKEVK